MNYRQDPVSTRRKVDELLDKAAIELRYAFSSDDEIKKELQEAVERVMREGGAR